MDHLSWVVSLRQRAGRRPGIFFLFMAFSRTLLRIQSSRKGSFLIGQGDSMQSFSESFETREFCCSKRRRGDDTPYLVDCSPATSIIRSHEHFSKNLRELLAYKWIELRALTQQARIEDVVFARH
jgi:hypothetical protein